MSSKDYIPSNDDEFDNMQAVVPNAAAANVTKWLIPSAVLPALTVKRTRWTAALTAYRNKTARPPAVNFQL